jgi:cysteinyl-tRNA synthetase
LYTALKDTPPDTQALDWNELYAQRFAEAMNDDFNTPVAVACLFELATEINRDHSAVLARQLKKLASVIGLLEREPQLFLQGGGSADGLSDDAVAAQISARTEAKKNKNFAESDKIRAELLAQGIVLEDKPGGITEWRRA